MEAKVSKLHVIAVEIPFLISYLPVEPVTVDGTRIDVCLNIG
jgi:hypothetical protein